MYGLEDARSPVLCSVVPVCDRDEERFGEPELENFMACIELV
jgi:hypothetical protein